LPKFLGDNREPLRTPRREHQKQTRITHAETLEGLDHHVVFIGIARIHRVAFPLADLAKIAAAGTVALVVTWSLAGDAHDLVRLGIAATGGVGVFLVAAVALRLIGPREWDLITTFMRRLAGRVGVGPS